MATTIVEWSKALHMLDQKACKRITRALWSAKDPDRELELSEQLQFMLIDWLSHLEFVTDATSIAIVQFVTNALEDYAKHLGGRIRQLAPIFTVVICDCRWVSCTGMEKFFDLEESEVVEQLPAFAVTHLMCDVTALYFRTVNRFERVSKLQQGRGTENGLTEQLDDEMSRKAGRASTPKTLSEWADAGSP